MKRYLPQCLIILLAVLISGCDVFPYISTTENTPPATDFVLPTDDPPTATPAPSPTPTTAEVTETPFEPTPVDSPVYTLQEGSPVALLNFNHPEAGCEWLGVAGQVFNTDGLEVLGLTVQVGDSLQPEQVPLQAQTGQALAYGLGGYEIQISEEVLETNARFWIQLVNAEGAPLTVRHVFDTTADCSQNLILINFAPVTDAILEKEAATPEPTPTTPAYP
jgi:hypothetical protein